MRLTASQLATICAATPADAAKYVDFINVATTMNKINTRTRAAMFFGQIAMETGRLRSVEENLSYSAQGLVNTWPRRFPSLAAAAPFARNPKALANKVYGGRMGNVGPNDGWLYRGRGLKQLTGKDNYVKAAKGLGVDFVANPDLVATPAYAASTAAWFWTSINGNSFADRNDYRGLTLAINGGLTGYEDGNSTGLDDRVELYQNADAKIALMGIGIFDSSTPD